MRAITYLAVMAVMVIPVAWQHRQLRRAARRSVPAAPDNQPGRDPQLLWECRRIDRQTPRKETRP
jgi:hypothetical protein